MNEKRKVLIKYSEDNDSVVYWGFSLDKMYPIHRFNVVVYIPFKRPQRLLARYDNRVYIYNFVRYRNGVLTVEQLDMSEQSRYRKCLEGGV